MSTIKQSCYTKNHSKKVGIKYYCHTLKKNRSHDIIWFNPPFSQNIKTNNGKIFLKLIKKHFSNHHHLHKIFNLNTIKLSYSCMSNMSSFIKQHTLIFHPDRQIAKNVHAIVERQLSTCWQLLETMHC